MFFNFGGGDDPFGGGGRMPQRRQADADTTALYKMLGIDKNASDSEIKKAYRKQAMETAKHMSSPPVTGRAMQDGSPQVATTVPGASKCARALAHV